MVPFSTRAKTYTTEADERAHNGTFLLAFQVPGGDPLGAISNFLKSTVIAARAQGAKSSRCTDAFRWIREPDQQ